MAVKVVLLAAALLLAGAAVPPAQAVHVVTTLCHGTMEEVCAFACDLAEHIPFNAIAGILECLP